ncbi:MAG: hypothetical protein U9O56_05610 [Campylobacterota bacterium]|nr:hypothetical protein [Campylobacterota bacterium]
MKDYKKDIKILISILVVITILILLNINYFFSQETINQVEILNYNKLEDNNKTNFTIKR